MTEYRRSGRILHIYSGACYISESEAHSRSGGYYFLGTKSRNNTSITEIPLEKVPMHMEFSILRNVMASSTEVELGGLFKTDRK